MKKKIFLKVMAILLLLILTFLATVPIRFLDTDRTIWMSELEDNRKINTIYIPGSHNAGSVYSMADIFGKCQSLYAPQQLGLGARFFDIRLCLEKDDFYVYHNIVEQKTAFSDLLEMLVSFLKECPSEFLLVSIKEELSPKGTDKDFTEELEKMLRAYPDIISTDTTLPETVGEARGKMYIISRYENSTMGIPCYDGWEKNTAMAIGDVYVQDHYKLEDIEVKKQDVINTFNIAKTGEYDLALNFVSCYFSWGFPKSYAGNTATKINPWLEEILEKGECAPCVYICDFFTTRFCELIIGRNFA